MCTYDPSQPFWKRAIAGVLDFLFSFIAIGNIVQRLVWLWPASVGTVGDLDSWASVKGHDFDLKGWPAALVLALVFAYFYVLGRTGGTLFQRLFGFKRA